MAQNIFKRVEQKYLLNEKQYLAIKKALKENFQKDKYFESKIYNLYFDNDNDDMMANSLDKPIYKAKIRIRSYQEVKKHNDIVFLEIKKKYKGIVYKRRITLTYKEYQDYINENKLPTHDIQIMKEIDYEIKQYNLKPKIFVAYDRQSYYSKTDTNFRITIDENLRSRFNELSLKDSKKNKIFFQEKTYIMELKSQYGLPLWFTKILSENNIYKKSFSKVGSIYTKEKGESIC